jgi:hypothetical protein
MRSVKFLCLVLMTCLLSVFTAHAQTTHSPNAAPKKNVKSKPNVKPTNQKSAKKSELAKRVQTPPVDAPLDSNHLSIAERVHVGHLPCELGASVRMTADAQAPGYFDLHGKGYKYRMRPVTTSTGAIRLEDEKAGAVWLQLANKSMLMDQKNGRRLADECAHPDQVAVANDMKVNPPPALIDVSSSATSVQR